MNKLIVLMLACLLSVNMLFAQRVSSEEKCNKFVKIEEKAWKKMLLEINKNGWKESSYPIIREWNEKQAKAREFCSPEKDGYIYEGIIVLNKRLKEFGRAGGFKVKY